MAVEEAVAYGFLTALGGYALLTAFDYPILTESGQVGPGLLPAVFSGLITVISAGLLLATLAGRRAKHDDGLAEIAHSVTADVSSGPDDQADEGLDIFGRTAGYRMRQLQMVTVALVVSLLLVPLVGLLVALGLFSLVASILVERRPWLSSVVITAVSLVSIYLVFAVFLEVPLPTGLLGFGG